MFALVIAGRFLVRHFPHTSIQLLDAVFRKFQNAKADERIAELFQAWGPPTYWPEYRSLAIRVLGEQVANSFPLAEPAAEASDEPAGPAVEESHFEFAIPEVRSGIDGVFDGTLYSIISYFTHSVLRQTKPLSVDLGELEDFVIENADDVRLVIGFFFYIRHHSYQQQRIER
jgi:hypothetical protein